MRLAKRSWWILPALVCSLSSAAAEPKITQDDLGRLQGDFVKVDKPLSSTALGAIQNVKAMWATPDSKRVVIHEWRTDAAGKQLDRLALIDAATGKVERVLLERAGGWVQRRSVCITPDGKSAFTPNFKGGGLVQISLDSGEIIKTIKIDHSFESLEFDSDASRAAAMTNDGGAVIFDLSSDKGKYQKLGFLPDKAPGMIYPLAGRPELLVHYGIAEKQNNIVALYDPKTDKAQTITEFDGNATVLPVPDGKGVCILRQAQGGGIAWTSSETWDLQALKQTGRATFQPPLASIGLKLSNDGQTLFLHEFMTRPVVVWNLKTGAIAGVVAPPGGGCSAFDITPDGKRVVATIGQWQEGNLRAGQLAVYDVSTLLVKP